MNKEDYVIAISACQAVFVFIHVILCACFTILKLSYTAFVSLIFILVLTVLGIVSFSVRKWCSRIFI